MRVWVWMGAWGSVHIGGELCSRVSQGKSNSRYRVYKLMTYTHRYLYKAASKSLLNAIQTLDKHHPLPTNNEHSPHSIVPIRN